MNLLDKIVFFFYNLTVAFLAVLFMIISLNLIPISMIGEYFHQLYNSPWQSVVSNVVIGLIFFIFSLRFIFMNTKKTRKSDNRAAITQSTEVGEIRISIEALETMAERVGRQIIGVRELNAKVIPTETGAKVAVKVSLDPETNIPETMTLLQVNVKEYVEGFSGISIDKVLVVVKDVLPKAVNQRSPLK
ncbi:hypothetical protein BHU72_02355 [Desulfuribacillus stibiiarsenatis]|uniref:Alkaline shock response membrane anchor protein AmaP n=1 Tax=Desulfuribacillus stibiiarsenatis TaxID=1390249 RepID=A0A1E5L698_9FIRM|nr:alkaline shock response membrane anchor protein AmaP [Desulfuribacillus stibiiarsenatis]OEH85660.1 hypothetical protein BHU72_02355 [Desulfuribacillus stibiiarsenatis]